MRLKKYLITEKLNLNYKLGEIYDSRDQWEAEFDVGDIEYTFIAERFYVTDSPEIMTHLGYADYYKGDRTIWDVEFRQDSMVRNPSKGQYDITGQAGGKALEVFSGVATALKTFLLRKNQITSHFPQRSQIDKNSMIGLQKWYPE